MKFNTETTAIGKKMILFSKPNPNINCPKFAFGVSTMCCNKEQDADQRNLMHVQ